MRNIIEIAKREFYAAMPHDGAYINFYTGGGFETLDLAKYALEGKVYSFSGGMELDTSCRMFESSMLDNIRLINDSPANMEVYIHGEIDGGVCRLDGVLVENEDKLIIATNKLLECLKHGGKLLFLYQKVGQLTAKVLENLSYKLYDCVKFASVNDPLSVNGLLIEKR